MWPMAHVASSVEKHRGTIADPLPSVPLTALICPGKRTTLTNAGEQAPFVRYKRMQRYSGVCDHSSGMAWASNGGSPRGLLALIARGFSKS